MKTSTDFGDLKSNGSDGYSDETREYEVIASQPENEVECTDDELDRGGDTLGRQISKLSHPLPLQPPRIHLPVYHKSIR